MTHVSATDKNKQQRWRKLLFFFAFAIPNEWQKVYQNVLFCYVCSFKKICVLWIAICDLRSPNEFTQSVWVISICYSFCIFLIGSAAQKCYIRKIIRIFIFCYMCRTVCSGYFCIACCWNIWKITHNFLAEMKQKLQMKKKLVDIPKMNVPLPIIIIMA